MMKFPLANFCEANKICETCEIYGAQERAPYSNCYNGKGFINGKLLMTEDKGRMFVVYTIMAVVHMILYYDEVILGYTYYGVLCNKNL